LSNLSAQIVNLGGQLFVDKPERFIGLILFLAEKRNNTHLFLGMNLFICTSTMAQTKIPGVFYCVGFCEWQ
jgi:hypothetical protein